MERRRVRFTGHVQGVGFRATTVAIARGYPITGWVRNEADGGVLLEAQGESNDVDDFLAALRDEMEPMIATTDVHPIDPVPAEGSFEVRR